MSTDLILQSPALLPEVAEQGAAIAFANQLHALSRGAYLLKNVDIATIQDIQTWSKNRKCDYAFIQGQPKLSDIKIIAMDMDSTLINIECIDEIAACAGLKDEVSAITEAAMRGEIKDFSESLNRRVALLKGVPESALETVLQTRLSLNPGAENLLKTAHAAGIKTLLVSGGFTFFTRRMQERLGFTETHANTLEIINGVLTGKVLGDIVDGQAKADHVSRFAQEHGADKEQIITMGDGSNDLLMMAQSKYSVAYRAKPIVQEKAAYSLNYSGLDGVLHWFSK